MKLDLYMKPTCPYCARVLGVIDEIGADVEIHNISEDSAARDTLISVGGKQQVPCLFIDGKPMYESSDIINWLRANC